MGGVMAALAKVTAVCDGLNTAFDAIRRCCTNFGGQTNTESTPEGNTTTTNNQSPTNNQLLSVGNTTTTNNTRSSGNNQHIVINVGERTSQLPSVGSLTAVVLAAVIGAYLTHRLPKKGEDGSNPEGNTTTTNNQSPTNNQSVGNTTTTNNQSPTNNQSVGNTTTTGNTQSSGNNQNVLIKEVVDKVEPIIMGPWGHPNEGFSFHHNGYDEIKTIRIWSGWVIDSIEVQYTKRGVLRWASKAGGSGGNLQEEIVLEDGEYINEVTGTYGRLFEMGTINSLTFFTNKNGKYGPYGLNTGTLRAEIEAEPTPFQVRGVKIVGFHGTSGSRFISSIGFYVTPLFDT